MTDEELREIEARANAAAPGPWRWEGDFPEGHCPHDTEWTDHGPHLMAGEHSVASVAGYDASSLGILDDDARFIAAARTDIPRLIAEIRRLREATERSPKPS